MKDKNAYYTNNRDSGAVVSRAVSLSHGASRKRLCADWSYKSAAAGAVLS